MTALAIVFSPVLKSFFGFRFRLSSSCNYSKFVLLLAAAPLFGSTFTLSPCWLLYIYIFWWKFLTLIFSPCKHSHNHTHTHTHGFFLLFFCHQHQLGLTFYKNFLSLLLLRFLSFFIRFILVTFSLGVVVILILNCFAQIRVHTFISRSSSLLTSFACLLAEKSFLAVRPESQYDLKKSCHLRCPYI